MGDGEASSSARGTGGEMGEDSVDGVGDLDGGTRSRRTLVGAVVVEPDSPAPAGHVYDSGPRSSHASGVPR